MALFDPAILSLRPPQGMTPFPGGDLVHLFPKPNQSQATAATHMPSRDRFAGTKIEEQEHELQNLNSALAAKAGDQSRLDGLLLERRNKSRSRAMKGPVEFCCCYYPRSRPRQFQVMVQNCRIFCRKELPVRRTIWNDIFGNHGSCCFDMH